MWNETEFTAELRRLGAAMVPEVLETMFFATAVESNESQCDGCPLNVGLSFRGTPSGTFHMRLDASAARALASAFLGRDAEELGTEEDAQTACELANMLCGSVLSRAESESSFELSSPELGDRADLAEARYRSVFLLDTGGALEVAFVLAPEALQ